MQWHHQQNVESADTPKRLVGIVLFGCFCFFVSFFVFLSNWYKLESSRNREPELRNWLHKIGLWASLGIFLISDWPRTAQPMAGGAIPVQVVLGCLRRQMKQAIVKPERGVLWGCCCSVLPGPCSAWVPTLASLSDESWSEYIRQMNLSSKVGFGQWFFTATEGKEDR